jgi:serine/threonine-protein kinase PknK
MGSVATDWATGTVIAVVESPGRQTRYRLLETVREFTHELLVEADELDSARERHLQHFSVDDEIPLDGWPSTRAEAILDQFEHDYGNVRAALEWAATPHPEAAARLLVARRDLFLMLGQADGRRIALMLLERYPARDAKRAELPITAGLLAMMSGDSDGAARDHDAARELGVELEEPGLEGWACFFRGLTEMMRGSPLEARARFERSRAIHRGIDIRIGEGLAMAATGLTYAMLDEPARGAELLEEALALQVEAGYGWGQGQAHLYLGVAADNADDHSRASAHYHSAVECLRPYRDSNLLPSALIGQAGALPRREAARALRIIAAAWTIRSRTGGEFAAFFRKHAVDVRTACEADLDTDSGRTWAEGTRMSVDDAIALALGTRPARPVPASGGLSARELEVVHLVASGRSNKAIAADLHLSVRTVESHVRHALAKVGLENRTQLAAWAHEHGR